MTVAMCPSSGGTKGAPQPMVPRVKVEGRVREYNGAPEVHAANWVVERTGPPEDPVAQVIGFYIGCVEAESAGSVRVRPRQHRPRRADGRLKPHPRPTSASCRQPRRSMVPAAGDGAGRIDHRRVADGDRRGSRRGRSRTRRVAAADIRRRTHAVGRWRGPSSPTAAASTSIHTRSTCSASTATSVTLWRDSLRRTRLSKKPGSPRTAQLRFSRFLPMAVLRGLAHLAPFEAPFELAPHNSLAGVHSTGMLIVASGSTQITRMLLEDLEQMLNNPKLLSSGPAAVLLGCAPAPASSLPKAHPTVVPSSLVQDQAVASAMENVLTVVTGPPGTGKSQVLVNTIAAAVARKETVLFASKNNQAVDVVFERLKLTSPDPCIVRAGASGLRREVASSITSILGTPRRTVDPAGARRAWVSVERRIRSIHEVLEQRALLEQEIHRLETDVEGRLDGHPEWVDVDADPAHLAEAVVKARTSLDALSGRARPLRSLEEASRTP